MTDKFKNERFQSKQEYYSYIPPQWVAQITSAITDEVIRAVIVTVSVVTAILILAGGVWLLNTFVPPKIFNIILAVILADILLGISLRYLVVRRKRRN